MRKILSVLLLSLSTTAFLYADDSPLKLDTMTLKNITPDSISYTGKVETYESVLLAFNVSGIIKNVLPLGTRVKAPLVNNSGKVVVPGTVVAEQYTQQQEYAVKAAELALEIAEVNYKKAKNDYDRQKTLIEKDAVAQQSYDDALNTLLNSKLTYENAVNSLATAKYNLSCTKIVAPFDGLISEIIRGPGRAANNGDDILQITRITPVMVKVPFPDVVRSLVDKSMVIKIFSKRMTEGMPAWVEPNPRDTLNSEFFVGNDLVVANDLTPELQKLPKVYEVLPATDMAMLPNPSFKTSKISVPETALKKDDKGYYLYKAEGQKALDLNKGIAQVFTVQKIYVTPGDVSSLFDLGFQGEVRYCDLKDPGNLQFHDVIIVKADDTIKDGGKAVLVQQQYMFQPGELVSVEIPALCKPGFYVPEKAIIIVGKGRNYVYLYENGKAKMTDVKVTGMANGYYRIEGKDIKDGGQVLIFNTLAELRSCYDGKPVQLGVNTGAPIQLEKPHCSPLRFPVQPAEEIYHL